METLNAIREDLEARQKRLLTRLGKINSHLRQESGPLNADWKEQAQELENEEVLQALDAHGREELEKIILALARMDAGTYGLCGECDDKIGERRLKAMPYTRLCIDCATEAEKKK
jgi:DnaK suppressor protein